MKRLLVTGGAGFIGANFVNYWLDRHPGDTLVVLDALSYAADLANLNPVRKHPGYTFEQGDIGDTPLVEQLMRQHHIDTIVHFAAESHVDRSIEGPDAFVQTNIIGTHSLLKAARKTWLDHKLVPTHRFHHVSTDEVYGSLGVDDPAFTEATPYAPNSPYSASKAASDHLVRAYHHTYGLNTTISNCSNNYGPFQFPEKLIPLMITQLMHGQPLRVYGDGLNIRDWLHVEDHCRGIEAVLDKGRVGGVYNIGGREEYENLRLVRLLCRMFDQEVSGNDTLRAILPDSAVARGFESEILIEFVKDRAGHDRRYAIDCSKIERECGFRPEITFEIGLARTIGWYLDRFQAQGGGIRCVRRAG